nr:hypothetical protein BaRGS_013620 [Batillaria attramentaria]
MGLAVKHFWAQLTNTQTLVQQMNSKNKLKEKETAHEMTLADLHRQKEELLRKHTTLEQELDQRKTQSTELQDQLKQSETKSQLEVATKTLAKEQGKNKSAAIHNQQVQAKQESLSGRIQELTQENEELRDEVAGLEEEKQELQESLQETRLIKEELEKEKQKQEETRTMYGTGNIVLDMENQVKANTIRMQVLDEQNEGLKRSITKVLSMGMGRQASQKPQIKKLSGQATTDVAFSVKGKQSRPSSSKNTQGVYGGSATRRGSAEEDAYPTYVCNNCDKMYTKARDLDIHKSYCTG